VVVRRWRSCERAVTVQLDSSRFPLARSVPSRPYRKVEPSRVRVAPDIKMLLQVRSSELRIREALTSSASLIRCARLAPPKGTWKRRGIRCTERDSGVPKRPPADAQSDWKGSSVFAVPQVNMRAGDLADRLQRLNCTHAGCTHRLIPQGLVRFACNSCVSSHNG
jgi:hypothetical protein